MNHLTIHKHPEYSHLRAYKAPLHLSRILYKSAPFMQNKPNFQKAQMNVTTFITKSYEQITVNNELKNKPNTNPVKPNLKRAKMNVSFLPTKGYENKPRLRPPQNKPKQTQLKSEARSQEWNVSHSSSDFYYRIMRKSRDQIYDDLLVRRHGPGDFEEAIYKTLTDTDKSGPAKADFKKGNRSSV